MTMNSRLFRDFLVGHKRLITAVLMGLLLGGYFCASAEAQTTYKERAATAECVNAQARNRGLIQLRVRGRLKAKAIALWHALGSPVQSTVHRSQGYRTSGEVTANDKNLLGIR